MMAGVRKDVHVVCVIMWVGHILYAVYAISGGWRSLHCGDMSRIFKTFPGTNERETPSIAILPIQLLIHIPLLCYICN